MICINVWWLFGVTAYLVSSVGAGYLMFCMMFGDLRGFLLGFIWPLWPIIGLISEFIDRRRYK